MALTTNPGGFITIGGSAGTFLVPDISQFAFFEPEPNLVAEGALRRSIEIELDANALVDKYEVIVTAKPAIATLAAEVAQLRIGGTGLELIIDFGAPRTVGMIRPGGGFTLDNVMGWDGIKFGVQVPIHEPRSPQTAILQETRTERLQLSLSGSGDKAALISETLLVLPDAPSDLELRIDDGPPVWRQNGAVRLQPGTELTPDGFNQNGERVVDVTGALAALTGDPTTSATRRFRLELTSRTAGRLDLAAPPERRSLRHIWRAEGGGEAEPRLVFAAEGAQTLALTAAGMPAEAPVTEVRLTLKGAVPPERVLPPIGPEVSDLVEIVLDANRAAVVRLPIDPRLASLTAIRLPLAVGAGGAQATLALWSSTGAGEPDAPIPTGVSKPVPLDEGAERWVSFPFDPPYTLAPPPPPPAAVGPLWAAVLVSRAEVTWRPTLAADAVEDAGLLRTGPSAGPWYALPALFDREPGNVFGRLRGRLRLAGLPGKATPIAPVRVEAGLTTVDTTPSDAGIRVTVPASASGRTLTVTALTAMTQTLSEIDVVTTG